MNQTRLYGSNGFCRFSIQNLWNIGKLIQSIYSNFSTRQIFFVTSTINQM